MSRRCLGWGAVLGLVAWLGGASAAQAQVGRRVAVSAFHVPDGARARQNVLEVLSEHAEVEVVSLADIAVAGARLDADASDAAGRKKLSAELGIDGWLDAASDDGVLQLSLRAPEGRLLARATLSDAEVQSLARVAGQRMWLAMGPWLSQRELIKRSLEAQQALAQSKQRARVRELERLHALAETRGSERVAQLGAAQSLARSKRALYSAELVRQRALVRERALAARKRQRASQGEDLASFKGGRPSGARQDVSKSGRSGRASSGSTRADDAAVSRSTQRWLTPRGGADAGGSDASPRSAWGAAGARPSPAERSATQTGVEQRQRR